MMNKGKTAIFIPAHNEENTIGAVVLLAKKHGRVFVIDDGSKDRTAKIAADAGAVVITREKNGGYGAALKTVLGAAKKVGAASSVILDGDMQHDPDEIPKISLPVLLGKADLAQGSRFKGKFVGAPLGRREGVAIINALYGLGRDGRKLDTQCGFRALSRKAVGTIRIGKDDYSAGEEIVTGALAHGLRICEVPVSVRYFNGRNGSPISQAAMLVRYAAAEIAKKRPLFYFGFSGVVMLVAAALSGLHVVETLYATRSLLVGTALVTVFFGIAGLVLLMAGVNLYMLDEIVRRIEQR
jgi:glycosyltransferase involved in cell wall biosynthesis